MKRVAEMLLMIVGLCAALSAHAQDAVPPAKECAVPAELLASDGVLKKVAAAAGQRKIDIVVVGTASSSLAGPGSAGAAYPARLEFALRQRVEKINVNVFSEVLIRRTADEMVDQLAKLVADRKPALVVWQTGTVDAMRGVNLDDFTTALEEGISAIQAAGADVLLMNPQYSPRTETMISVTPFMDNMRVVAQQREVPLFDRFAIMRHWSETGEFDLFGAFHGLGLAKRVHDCIGRALAEMVVNTAHLKPEELKGRP
jgi:hypothetical protein